MFGDERRQKGDGVTDEVASNRVVGADHDLDLLFEQVNALRELASDPGATRDSARVYAFSIRWGVMLAGRLERLAHYHGRGELTPRDRTRYDALRTELRDVLSLIERLGLARPAVPLDEPGFR